jgi:hypothetical protein
MIKKHAFGEQMFSNKKLYLSTLLVFLLIAIITACAASYFGSSLVARIVLIASFFTSLFLLVLVYKTRYFGMKTVYLILLAICLIFALYNANFMLPQNVEDQLHYEENLVAQQYSQTGHLEFSSPHSYFFFSPMLNLFLSTELGLTPSLIVYVNFAIFVSFITLVSILIFHLAKKQIEAYSKSSTFYNILPPLIAVLSISFANTARGGTASVLALLPLWLVFDGRFKSRSIPIIMSILVLAITWGNTVGALFLIPFFFIASILGAKSKLFYSFIPLGYFVFSASSYVLNLKGFVSSAWNGFVTYIRDIFANQIPARVLPWERTPKSSNVDIYITSIAYLSLILLSLFVILILTFSRERNLKKSLNLEGFRISSSKAALICLWIFIGVSAITYLGTVAVPESSISDIRTIAIVFITFPLLFLLISDKFIRKVKNRILLASLIVLIILASMFTLYGVSPKSVHDPINVVEDSRLEPFSKYSAGNFLYNYGNETTVVLDYKIYIANALLESSNMTVSMLSGLTLSEGNIVMFDANGLKYGSLYISPELYSAANNLTETQDVIYTSGNITGVFINNSLT